MSVCPVPLKILHLLMLSVSMDPVPLRFLEIRFLPLYCFIDTALCQKIGYLSRLLPFLIY